MKRTWLRVTICILIPVLMTLIALWAGFFDQEHVYFRFTTEVGFGNYHQASADLDRFIKQVYWTSDSALELDQRLKDVPELGIPLVRYFHQGENEANAMMVRCRILLFKEHQRVRGFVRARKALLHAVGQDEFEEYGRDYEWRYVRLLESPSVFIIKTREGFIYVSSTPNSTGKLHVDFISNDANEVRLASEDRKEERHVLEIIRDYWADWVQEAEAKRLELRNAFPPK